MLKMHSLKLILSVLLTCLTFFRISSCYMLVLSAKDSPGLVIFDAGITTKPGQSPRRYIMNYHRSASFIKHLIHVDHYTGSVVLKRWLECDGIRYPLIFTVYIDSLSNSTLNYISFPIRILIQSCHENESGDLLDVSSTRSWISEAKRWPSETLASFAIHGDKDELDSFILPVREVCVKQSQLITNIAELLMPLTISRSCQVRYVQPDDPRFVVEPQGADLVAGEDFCIPTDPPGVVRLTVEYICEKTRTLLSPATHTIKLHFVHRRESDSARVRRDLQNKAPVFEKVLYTATAAEEQPPGLSVCAVSARDPAGGPLTYAMVSLLDARSQAMFAIDAKSGVVSTLTSLDRELMDVHYFRVTASDKSFPAHSASTTLQVHVQDTNDHAPIFEADSGEYQASVRESVPVGSTVTTVRATDKDMGNNAQVEYSIASVSGGGLDEAAGVFAMDGRSGVLTTRSQLDRERTQVYTVVVTATDQALPASERQSSSVTVVVSVQDDNDNYPQFSERTYSVTIPEDMQAAHGPIIATVKATDADEGHNAAIRYAIIGGNTQGQFSIDSQSGEVSLMKPLDYENTRSFRINIRVQDGGSPGKSNTTLLLVNVKDVNDNAPRFYSSLFQEAVSENVPIGYSIVRVQAYDADEGRNAELKYEVSARDWEGTSTQDLPITVDNQTGWVHTTRLLDRETHNKFQFEVLAIDGGTPAKTATASVVLTVQDVNDNDPVFSPKQYEATIAEDDPPGTPVTSVTATDTDENPRLHYELTGGNIRGRFALTTHNGRGLITVAQPLDYKQEKRFILTVRATDSGGRFDTATIYVNVSDANNFAPVFDNAPYTATVFEDSPVGSTVMIVAATDGDVGQNAQITYLLSSTLGESSDFAINAQTGAIVTTRLLDRETQSGYLLTVTARDNGNPPLADSTDVEISVADVNDNSPRFLKPAYSGSVSEDALVGTSVLQVSAVDEDTGLNGRVRYALGGAPGTVDAFVMDPVSGVIRTAKTLDRESVAQYEIEALAIDRGTPQLSGSVMVTINIEDVNDSPPAFESDKLTLYIAENSPVGSTVGELHARDPDEGQNAVVQYSIIGGEDSDSFSLVRRPGSDKAELLTMVELDYESSRKRFELIVRAASPPLRSDVHVEILVTDVNDNAPRLKDFQIIFNNFRDCFPAGVFGRIPAIDDDVSDKLVYRILSGNNANLLRLNESSGQLSLSPQLNTNVPKLATMEVSVTDGVNEVKAMMQLSVRLVTDEMLLNSVTVRLADMTEQAFLSPLLGFFVEGLAAIVPCPKENIYVFNVQDDTDVNARILNVSFSAKLPDGQFYSPQFLQERVYLNRAVLARIATVQVLPFDDNLCVREPCLNFERCLTVLKFGNASGFISSDSVLFRPIYPVSTFACRCPTGFTGSREHYLCDTEVNLCYSNPCLNEGTCKRKEGGYTCACTSGFTGDNCEIDLSLDTCRPGICQSGSTCSPLIKGGFVCDDCAPSGTFEHYDRLCQLRGRSFPRHSFLTFPALRQRHRLHIALKFATLQESGLLLYNGRYNERHDFVALEIVEAGGGVQFSFSLGSDVTRVVARAKNGVNDGRWHTVTADYFDRSATVSLDDCDTTLTISYGESLGLDCANASTQLLEDRCAVVTETCHRFLDLTGPLQIGGLPSLPASTPFQVASRGFVGCIADVHVDHRLLDLNSHVADNGTLIGCPQRQTFCSSDPCHNGGTCSDEWDTFNCQCMEGWSGKDCSQAIRPAWRFHGDGMVSFNPLLRQIQLPWLTALSFRTLEPTGLLIDIQIGQNTSAVLYLEDGHVVYEVEGQRMVLGTVRASDGAWHRTQVTWTVAGITLDLDYGLRTVSRASYGKSHGIYVGRIIVGGTEDQADKQTGFTGCIQDIRVGMGQSQSPLENTSAKLRVTDGCASDDSCNDNSCPPHSQCVADWQTHHCQCNSGYAGPQCVSICELNPCKNGGKCVLDRSALKGYTCHCNYSNYSGEYCEVEVEQSCPVSWWGHPVCGPCDCPTHLGYSPDCGKTTGRCSCKENHYQIKGLQECLPCNCYATGSYNASCDAATGQCHCRNGVIGRACDSCPNPFAEVTLRGCEVVYDGCPRSFTHLWWPRTPFGEEALEPCPGGSHGRAARRCDALSGTWLAPDIFNCTSDVFMDLRKLLNQLETNDVSVTTFVAVGTSGSLSRATNTTRSLYGADVLVTEQLLERLIRHENSQAGLNLTHSQDKDYIANVVRAASAILRSKTAGSWRRVQELTGRTAGDLVDSIASYLDTLATSQHDTYTDPFETVTSNLVVGLDTVTPDSLFGYESDSISRDPASGVTHLEKVVLPDTSQILHPPIQFSPLIAKKVTPSQLVKVPKYNNYLENSNKFDSFSHVLIPLDLLNIKPPQKGETWAREGRSVGRAAVVGYAEYRTLADVLPLTYDQTVLTRWGVDLAITAPVFTVTATPALQGSDLGEVTPRSLSQLVPLPSPVRLRLRLDPGTYSQHSNPQCVHWSTARGYGEWSRAGCQTEMPAGDWWHQRYVLINCTCHQLGSFSVIQDIVGPEYVGELSVAENLVTWVGFALSLWALAMATLILGLLRAKTNSSAIYTNQAFCLLVAEALYLVALKARSSLVLHEVGCKLMAMALHYAWLAALCWWLVGSLHLYRMLTEVRDVNHGPMRVYFCLGYSLPAVVVGLSVGVRADQYGNVAFCWLSLYESVIWSMLGPGTAVIFVNLAVLVFSLRAAFTLKDHVAGYGNLRTLLWLNVVSLPLVAAVWLLCLVTASEHQPLLTYALAALLPVQAWFLLGGYCLGNARVRAGLRRACLQLMGRKVPPLPDDDPPRPSSSQTTHPRSALAYRSAGVSVAPGVSGFEAARRHLGISTSSTTSRSTTKTGSSPYRSDTQLRHTSTSTSNYDQSASDVGPVYPRRTTVTQHTSDSESEASLDGRSLELASSHSSDEDESGQHRRRGQRAAANAPHSHPHPPPHLNVIANSELFHPIYAPRWPNQAPTIIDEHLAVDEGVYLAQPQHRWTNMSLESPHEHKLLNSYYTPPGSETEDKAVGDKYLFPYTAEEDHVSGVYSSARGFLSEHRPPPTASPSPLMMHLDFQCPDISENEKDTSETPV